MDNHTKEPWTMQQQDPFAPVFILGPEPENRFIARMGWGFDHGDTSTKQDRMREIADSGRACAAVNACAGIPTAELEAGIIGEMKLVIQALYNQENWDGEYAPINSPIGRARALLARMEG